MICSSCNVSWLIWVPLGHGCDSKDRFKIQRIQLRDTCFRFLEESITFQFFCIMCVMLLVLCTAGIQGWNFLKHQKKSKKNKTKIKTKKTNKIKKIPKINKIKKHKKSKRGLQGVHAETPQKNDVIKSNVTRNRAEIEAKAKSETLEPKSRTPPFKRLTRRRLLLLR